MLLEKVDKAAGAAGGRQPKAAAGFVPLFNGKDLTGWKANGKATFVVKDGCIVGTEPAGDAGDLMTEKEFDNFEFRVTYRVVWPANTGFWFRTGYQYDILRYKNPVAYSGSLYGGSSGKLFVTTNTDESLENADGWNEARVWANGDHIILWLNGKKVGDCHDKAHAKGRFGIQVYGTKEFINMKVIVKRFDVRALKADEPAPTR
jgi:hypothetical protein